MCTVQPHTWRMNGWNYWVACLLQVCLNRSCHLSRYTCSVKETVVIHCQALFQILILSWQSVAWYVAARTWRAVPSGLVTVALIHSWRSTTYAWASDPPVCFPTYKMLDHPLIHTSFVQLAPGTVLHLTGHLRLLHNNSTITPIYLRRLPCKVSKQPLLKYSTSILSHNHVPTRLSILLFAMFSPAKKTVGK